MHPRPGLPVGGGLPGQAGQVGGGGDRLPLAIAFRTAEPPGQKGWAGQGQGLLPDLQGRFLPALFGQHLSQVGPQDGVPGTKEQGRFESPAGLVRLSAQQGQEPQVALGGSPFLRGEGLLLQRLLEEAFGLIETPLPQGLLARLQGREGGEAGPGGQGGVKEAQEKERAGQEECAHAAGEAVHLVS